MSWLALVPAASLVLALGCSGNDYPRPPFDEGGGPCVGCPGGGPSVPDGGGNGADGGDATISGTLCQLSDPRQPTVCDNIDYSGIPLTETVGGDTAVASASGSWVLTPPTSSSTAIVSAAAGDATRRNAIVGVELGLAGSDAGIPGGASGVIVPLLDSTFWDDLQTNIGAVEQNNTATILVYARNGVAPLAGGIVLSPTGEFTVANTYYENIIVPGPDAWDLNGPTGPFGAVLIFNATTADGAVDVELTDGLVSVVASVPVADGAISVVSLDIADGI